MTGRLPWGLELPLRPFFGVMAVAPPAAWGSVSTLPPRRNGGNLDNKELVAGTTLYLPIHVDGALFSVGDGHGVQGDGEVCVTAIETGLIGTFELIVREDMHLEWPRAETPTHVMTMAFDPDLDDCVVIALRQMVDLVAKEAGIKRAGGLRAVQPRRRRAHHAGRQRLQGRARHAGQALPGARGAIVGKERLQARATGSSCWCGGDARSKWKWSRCASLASGPSTVPNTPQAPLCSRRRKCASVLLARLRGPGREALG